MDRTDDRTLRADRVPDPALRERLRSLCEDGRAMWARFASEVRRDAWHPFMPGAYEVVLRRLLPLRGPDRRFLEFGSATGVITIMADLLGFEACGIEIDPDLVSSAGRLARRHDSNARFAAGSFLPAGYVWRDERGDERLGTIEIGEPGYAELGLDLHHFDVVYAYPWHGEAPVVLDLMRRRGSPEATLLLHDHTRRVDVYRGGRLAS